MPQTFTLEEANLVIEQIRPLMKRIMEIRQVLMAKQPELLPVLQKIAGNGGSKTASHMLKEFRQLETLVAQVQETGALVTDINTGLVDFPSILEGREVLLCWQYDEPTIGYWHETDAGFSGRQPL